MSHAVNTPLVEMRDIVKRFPGIVAIVSPNETDRREIGMMMAGAHESER